MIERLRTVVLLGLAVAGIGLAAPGARAEDDKSHYTVYGFAMLDAGYFSTAVDPTWFDTQRPSKLPSFKDQYGNEGQTFFSVRQSRLGVKSSTPTSLGELKAQFEFDMYGVGVDAGQTTIRPRIFYGELGHVGAGQIASAFMDLDVFPNCLDYWGPNGMLFFRNPQIRWMPVMKEKQKLTLALERPGASGDQGAYSDRIQVSGARIVPSFPVPDASGNFRQVTRFGYVQVGGIVRDIRWRDLNATPTLDLSGHVTGWGATASTNINLGKSHVIRGQLTHGEGIENYFNDAPIDVGAKPDPTNTLTPVTGQALPITGVSVFDDITWNAKFGSTLGYSQVVVENSAGQAPNAYHFGQYALANVTYTPVANFMWGAEVGYEKRRNNADGFTSDAVRVQTSFKYNFSVPIGGAQ
jgi:hypothetical protein